MKLESVKTRQQMAYEFNICVRTLNRWIQKEQLDIPRGRLLIKHQLLIYRTFGDPESAFL